MERQCAHSTHIDIQDKDTVNDGDGDDDDSDHAGDDVTWGGGMTSSS